MSTISASGYLDSVKRLFSREISLTEAKDMLEQEIDREKMTKLRNELGDYTTEKVAPEDDGYAAYAIVHKAGTELNVEIPIGEMKDGEWDLHYGFDEFF